MATELPLKGSLTEVSFISLLKDAAISKLTGMIRLETGPVIKVVYMQQGTVAFASSNEKTDRLTEVLKRAGKLTPEQIEHAQARLKPNVSLGKTLVELGYISPRDLLWGARMQVEGILHQLLFWDQGNYQRIEGPLPKEIVSLTMSVPQIIFDGILKTHDRHWVLQHIGSPEAVYTLTSDFHEKNAGFKLPVEETVSRINGKRSLEEIAQTLGVDTFEVCKTAAALQILELAQRVEKTLQVPLLMTESVNQNAAEIGKMSKGGQKISLGQVLQIPTVEELQQEPEEEADTIQVRKAPPELPPAEPTIILSSEPTIIQNSLTPSEALEEQKGELEQPEAFVSAAEKGNPVTIDERPLPMESFRAHRSKHRGLDNSVWDWRKTALIMAIIAVLTIAGAAVYSRFLRPGPAPQSARVPEPPAWKKPEPVKQPATSTITPAKPSNQSNPPSKPESTKTIPPPKEPSPTPVPVSGPLGLLQKGKVADAAREWQKQLSPKKMKFTIQLEIACKESTVIEAAQILKYSNDISIIPLNYHGQPCYRVLYGIYPSAAAAESSKGSLPNEFLQQEAKPAVIPVAKALK